MEQNGLKKNDYFLITSFLAILLPIVLLVFRAEDDNRLTSWNWAFNTVDRADFFLILTGAVVAAWGAAARIRVGKGKPYVLFGLSFFLAALFWQEPEVIVDAARYFSQAKYLEIYGFDYFHREWGRAIFAWTDLPLVPFIYGIIFKYCGESRLVVQIFTTSLFAATVVITYLLGKTLWDEDMGYCAGLLLLGFPYLLTQVPLMLVDIPTMFFLTLAVFTLVKALHHGGAGWVAAASLAIFFAFYVKYSTWVLLSEVGIIFLYYLWQAPGQTVRRGGPIALVVVIFIGLVVADSYDIIAGQLRFLMEYQKPGLKRWGESLFSTLFFQTHPFITAAAGYSLFAALKKKDFRYVMISYLIVLLLGVMQVKRIRYTLPVFPMLALMASYGLRDIKNPEVRNHIVLCAVASSLVIALCAYVPFLRNMSAVNLMNAGRFLDSLAITKARVVTLTGENDIASQTVAVPLLDLYTRKRLVFFAEPDAIPPDLEKVKESSLRFTWEYPMPEYYEEDSGESQGADALVLVSGSREEPWPESLAARIKGYQHSASFNTTTSIFSYQTIVRVFYN